MRPRASVNVQRDTAIVMCEPADDLIHPSPRFDDSGCAVMSVEFGDPKFTPVRTVVSRSRMCPTGKYPSWKMGRMLHWESTSELCAFRLLDCDPQVERFDEQPCEIVYVLDSETRRHYPDIYVESKIDKQLWEIKIDRNASQPEIAARTKLLTEELKQHGFTYRLVLDSELRRQPRLQNANTLLRYGRIAIDELRREWVRLTLRRAGSLTWGAACNGAYGPDARQLLCRLVLEGVLAVDMDQPLSAETLFKLSGGDR
jgi:hypothetical protein